MIELICPLNQIGNPSGQVNNCAKQRCVLWNKDNCLLCKKLISEVLYYHGEIEDRKALVEQGDKVEKRGSTAYG